MNEKQQIPLPLVQQWLGELYMQTKLMEQDMQRMSAELKHAQEALKNKD